MTNRCDNWSIISFRQIQNERESKADEFVHDSSNICGVINYRITSTRKIYQEKGYLIEEDEGLA